MHKDVLGALALGIVTIACGERAQTTHPVTVFAAASLSDVLPQVAQAWHDAGGQPVTP